MRKNADGHHVVDTDKLHIQKQVVEECFDTFLQQLFIVTIVEIKGDLAQIRFFTIVWFLTYATTLSVLPSIP
jgi:hypothetical protein